jgi:hypothetical protein
MSEFVAEETVAGETVTTPSGPTQEPDPSLSPASEAAANAPAPVDGTGDAGAAEAGAQPDVDVEKMKYMVVNKDTGEVYSILDLDQHINVQTYSMFPTRDELHSRLAQPESRDSDDESTHRRKSRRCILEVGMKAKGSHPCDVGSDAVQPWGLGLRPSRPGCSGAREGTAIGWSRSRGWSASRQ